MTVLYPRASWDSNDGRLPPPKTVLPYQCSKELNQGLANSPAVGTFMTSDLKVTVFKPDSRELHDFGTTPVVKTRPDPLRDTRKGLTHTKDGRDWVNRKVTANSVQTLMVWKCFWCAGIPIYPLDWQSRSISAPALSFWMQKANWDRTWGPWLTPPKINENERRFCTPLLLHRCQTQHGEGSDLIPIWKS